MKVKMGEEVKLYTLTSVLDGSERTKPHPGRCTPRKGNNKPLYRRLGGHHIPSRWGRKISSPPGFDLRTVQLVANPTTLFLATKHMIRVHNSSPNI